MKIINEGEHILKLVFSTTGVNSKVEEIYPGNYFEVKEIAGALYISTIKLNNCKK